MTETEIKEAASLIKQRDDILTRMNDFQAPWMLMSYSSGAVQVVVTRRSISSPSGERSIEVPLSREAADLILISFEHEVEQLNESLKKMGVKTADMEFVGDLGQPGKHLLGGSF